MGIETESVLYTGYYDDARCYYIISRFARGVAYDREVNIEVEYSDDGEIVCISSSERALQSLERMIEINMSSALADCGD